MKIHKKSRLTLSTEFFEFGAKAGLMQVTYEVVNPVATDSTKKGNKTDLSIDTPLDAVDGTVNSITSGDMWQRGKGAFERDFVYGSLKYFNSDYWTATGNQETAHKIDLISSKLNPKHMLFDIAGQNILEGVGRGIGLSSPLARKLARRFDFYSTIATEITNMSDPDRPTMRNITDAFVSEGIEVGRDRLLATTFRYAQRTIISNWTIAKPMRGLEIVTENWIGENIGKRLTDTPIADRLRVMAGGSNPSTNSATTEMGALRSEMESLRSEMENLRNQPSPAANPTPNNTAQPAPAQQPNPTPEPTTPNTNSTGSNSTGTNASGGSSSADDLLKAAEKPDEIVKALNGADEVAKQSAKDLLSKLEELEKQGVKGAKQALDKIDDAITVAYNAARGTGTGTSATTPGTGTSTVSGNGPPTNTITSNGSSVVNNVDEVIEVTNSVDELAKGGSVRDGAINLWNRTTTSLNQFRETGAARISGLMESKPLQFIGDFIQSPAGRITGRVAGTAFVALDLYTAGQEFENMATNIDRLYNDKTIKVEERKDIRSTATASGLKGTIGFGAAVSGGLVVAGSVVAGFTAPAWAPVVAIGTAAYLTVDGITSMVRSDGKGITELMTDSAFGVDDKKLAKELNKTSMPTKKEVGGGFGKWAADHSTKMQNTYGTMSFHSGGMSLYEIEKSSNRTHVETAEEKQQKATTAKLTVAHNAVLTAIEKGDDVNAAWKQYNKTRDEIIAKGGITEAQAKQFNKMEENLRGHLNTYDALNNLSENFSAQLKVADKIAKSNGQASTVTINKFEKRLDEYYGAVMASGLNKDEKEKYTEDYKAAKKDLAEGRQERVVALGHRDLNSMYTNLQNYSNGYQKIANERDLVAISMRNMANGHDATGTPVVYDAKKFVELTEKFQEKDKELNAYQNSGIKALQEQSAKFAKGNSTYAAKISEVQNKMDSEVERLSLVRGEGMTMGTDAIAKAEKINAYNGRLKDDNLTTLNSKKAAPLEVTAPNADYVALGSKINYTAPEVSSEEIFASLNKKTQKQVVKAVNREEGTNYTINDLKKFNSENNSRDNNPVLVAGEAVKDVSATLTRKG